MRRRWRTVLGVVLVTAAVAYLGQEIGRNVNELRLHPWRADLLLLLASLAAHVTVLAWGVYVWRLVLRAMAPTTPSLRRMLRIWFLSSLARYIPGKVFQFVAVAQLSGREAVAPSLLVTTLVANTLMTVATGLMVGVVLLASLQLGFQAVVVPAIVAMLLGVATVHPVVARRLVGLIERLPERLGVSGVRWRATWLQGMWILAASALAWLLYGAAFHLLIASLSPVEVADYPRIAAANALSFVAGFMSLLPAGIGVREVALAELLRGVLPGGIVAMVAVVARLWTIAAELAGGALAIAITRGAAGERGCEANGADRIPPPNPPSP